ncbi:LOW QUALITY PROTEIN: leucine-rich repeat protein SHOC-2-like [Dendronephthya gigantea]|uniref:LOW QUALITY PROTEIN: leucine-rich repeat protein SHOC-2-like n=1 Tax=Dendronephthya gigantea TaxID=151771 RepID=UPI00106BAC85|nr:LOW QUALITY PROTEIN: leucine-rich repeat protein SHOC-2-like [Dendronephthya gigantea]
MANNIEEFSFILQKISACIERDDGCLDLSSLENDITEIPDEIFQSFSEERRGKINELILDFNDFEFVPASIVTRFKSLKKLSVEGNNLIELSSSFGELVGLEELRLNENKLCEIPVSFNRLKNLKLLSLVANHLHTLPSEIIEGLSNLSELYLDENELSSLPDNFKMLKSLKVLELSENKLISLPESFGELKELEVLNLSRNKLSSLPSSFGDLGRLQSVDLSDNDISVLPDNFHSAAVIESLYLDNNILGVLPGWFGQLSSIICLSLNDNKLQGSPFPNIFPMVSKNTLKKLEMGGNAISHLPKSIGELCQLEELHIGSTICELERRHFQNGNWIRELPESFGQLYSVKKLYLDENQIAKLPDSFGNLFCLSWIDLGQNMLSHLPDTFCNLTLLEYCQLSKNELACLPSDFGKLTRLKDLRLDSNMLENLPESCANLHALHTLDLFNNKLTQVPEWLSKLSSLRRLDLDSNKLSLKLKDVPHLASKGSVYAERDPNLKDNWRGKMRADKVRAEVVVINSEDGTNGDDYEEELYATPSTYNENALFAAMRRGFNGVPCPDERQVKQSEHNTPDVVFNVFEDASDNSTRVFSGFFAKIDKKEDGEDWDREINESWGKNQVNEPTSELSFGVHVGEVELEKRNEFLTTLSAYPPASQAYSVTAMYESMACRKLLKKYDQCNNLYDEHPTQEVLIQGQFEDAD